MTATAYILTLVLVSISVSIPILFWCFRLLRSLRQSIEKKIDQATDMQKNGLEKRIRDLQTDVNEIKRELKTLRQVAAFVNKTPLPDCMKDV